MINIIFSVLAISVGVFMIYYGGIDDSPGAQGLGLVSIIIGLYILLKDKIRNMFKKS